MTVAGLKMKSIIFLALTAILVCTSCYAEKPEVKPPDNSNGNSYGTVEDKSLEFKEYAHAWKGYGTQEELDALNKMSSEELVEFLKDIKREPALRVEAIRLLTELTVNKKELYPVFITCLRSPTIREREAALYFFSRFGTPNHIVAVEASIMGVEACPDYSVLSCNCIDHSIECTIMQILERAGEKQK